MSCFCAGSASKKYQPREPETESVQMEFKHVPEPQQSELVNYLRSRREHVHIYMNTADIKVSQTLPSSQPHVVMSCMLPMSLEGHSGEM